MPYLEREKMQSIIDVTDNFKKLVQHGIVAKNAISLNKQSDILYEWFALCLRLPNSCDPELYTDDHPLGSLIKERMMSTDYEHNITFSQAGFFVNRTPMYFWEFDIDGIIFIPITKRDESTFEDWCSNYLFDLEFKQALEY